MPSAEHQVRIVVGQHMLGEQPFFDLHGQTALEQHRPSGLGGGDEQLEALRIAGADHQDVGVFGDHVRVVFRQQFRDGQAGLLARLGEELRPFSPSP